MSAASIRWWRPAKAWLFPATCRRAWWRWKIPWSPTFSPRGAKIGLRATTPICAAESPGALVGRTPWSARDALVPHPGPLLAFRNARAGRRGRRPRTRRSAPQKKSPERPEERAQQLDAFHRQDTFDHLDAVIEEGRIRHLELTAHASETQVAGAEDEALDARRNQRSGAHHARLKRAVQGGAGEAVVSQPRRRLPDG